MKYDSREDILTQIEKLKEIISIKDRIIKDLEARVKGQSLELRQIHFGSKQGMQSRKMIASWNPFLVCTREE